VRLQTKITLPVEKHTTQHNCSFPRFWTSGSTYLRSGKPTRTGSYRIFTG